MTKQNKSTAITPNIQPRRITRLIRDEISRKPESLSVVAHSFGTYIIAKILEQEADLQFHRLIFCGSIVPDSFKWEIYGHRLNSDQSGKWQAVNDCGMNDIWPVFAKSVTWGYGSSGRFGFGHPRIKDRFFNATHSSFFDSNFIREYWLPFLSKGKIVEGILERATTPWWVSVLTVVRLKYVIFIMLIIAVSAYLVYSKKNNKDIKTDLQNDTFQIQTSESPIAPDITKVLDVKPTELTDIVSYFFAKNNHNWNAFEFSHGTMGQLPVKWSGPCRNAEEDNADSVDNVSKNVCREGELYILIKGNPEHSVDENGIVTPWKIRLIGTSTLAKFGYDRIELEANSIGDIMTYLNTSMDKKGFITISNKCKSSITQRFTLYNISRRGYKAATVLQQASIGAGSIGYTFNIFPFSKYKCDDFTEDTELGRLADPVQLKVSGQQ